jgi:hypothetical protein
VSVAIALHSLAFNGLRFDQLITVANRPKFGVGEVLVIDTVFGILKKNKMWEGVHSEESTQQKEEKVP